MMDPCDAPHGFSLNPSCFGKAIPLLIWNFESSSSEDEGFILICSFLAEALRFGFRPAW